MALSCTVVYYNNARYWSTYVDLKWRGRLPLRLSLFKKNLKCQLSTSFRYTLVIGDATVYVGYGMLDHTQL